MTLLGNDKTCVIDIGSNSVRCAFFENDKLLFKKLITSRLGEGMNDGELHPHAIERTVDAVFEFFTLSESEGAKTVLAFATEAVRRAKNKGVFLSRVKEKTGLTVTVVEGEMEGELALCGSLGETDGCVIDLGGASTEVAIRQNGKAIYCRSVGVGAVTLKNECGRDKDKLTAYIAQKCREYGEIPQQNTVVAVGGTATSIALCKLGTKVYNPKDIDGTVLTREDLNVLANSFSGKTAEQINQAYGVDIKRAEIIFGGALLLREVLALVGCERLTVSESDNLEGFFTLYKKGVINKGLKYE